MRKLSGKLQMRRMTQILKILTSHGFGHVFGKRKRKKQGDQPSKRLFSRIRLVLEDLGPTFIKLGQIFANRPDVIPLELAQELSGLQDKVSGFSFEEAKATLEEEYDKPLDSVFLHFDPLPVACASMAQVHVATLKTGQRVAVKIQRPGLEEIISQDLEILYQLANFLEEFILKSNAVNIPAILDEFEKSLNREINFQNEALFLKKFAGNFKNDERIKIPTYFPSYSTKKVLVMEYIEGVSPLDKAGLNQWGISGKKLAHLGALSFLEQIFNHGFFHADPHPGNILILSDGRLAYLDFGMMGVIFGPYQDHLAGMLLATASSDAHLLAEHLMGLGQAEGEPFPSGFEEDIFVLLETYGHLNLKDFNIGQFISSMIELILKYKLRLPPSLFLLVKALLTTEGLARELDPDFDMISHITPFVRRRVLQGFHPKKLVSRLYDTSLAYMKMVEDLPENAKILGQFIKRGKVNFVLDSMDRVLGKADQISNRISFSMIITGLIVGSSLVIQSRTPPLIWGLSLFGIIGFFSAGIMGFALIISIWRSGRF